MKSNLRIVFILFLVFAEIAILGFPSILFPFGRDQATGAYVANLWFNGKVPYLYAVEVRPPANYLPFLLAQYLFQNSEPGIRVLDLMLIFFTSIILFLIAEKIFSRLIGIISSFTFPILYYGYFDFWHSCQMEGWQIIFISLGIYLYLRNDSKNSQVIDFLSGLCFGISFLFKFTSLPFLAMFFVLGLLKSKRERVILPKPSVDKYQLFSTFRATLVMGFVSPILFCLIYFHSKGALEALKEVLFDFVILEYSRQSIPIDWGKINFNVLIVYILWLILTILGVLSIVVKIISVRTRSLLDIVHRELVIILWFILSIFLVIWQGKYYFYHLLVCLPSIAILISLGIHFVYCLCLEKGNQGKKIFLLFILSFFLCQTFYSFLGQRLQDWKRFISYSMNSIERKEYYESFTGPHDFNYQESFSVGRYINNNSSSSDKILFLGYDPIIYTSSERESASRFYSTHLIFNFSSSIRSKWMKEYFRVILESSSLRYIIVPHWEIDFIEQISTGIYNTEIIQLGIIPTFIPRLPGEMQVMQPIGVKGSKFVEKIRIGKFLIFEKENKGVEE